MGGVQELEIEKEIHDECDEDSEEFKTTSEQQKDRFDLMKSCEYDRAESIKTIQAT
ncbi:hypothetical protein SARC_05248, partial [Sphaeroforma arctica JP610]